MPTENPQILSNHLANIFGVVAILVALCSIFISVYQHRQASRQHPAQSNDLERQQRSSNDAGFNFWDFNEIELPTHRHRISHCRYDTNQTIFSNTSTNRTDTDPQGHTLQSGGLTRSDWAALIQFQVAAKQMNEQNICEQASSTSLNECDTYCLISRNLLRMKRASVRISSAGRLA